MILVEVSSTGKTLANTEYKGYIELNPLGNNLNNINTNNSGVSPHKCSLAACDHISSTILRGYDGIKSR